MCIYIYLFIKYQIYKNKNRNISNTSNISFINIDIYIYNILKNNLAYKSNIYHIKINYIYI